MAPITLAVPNALNVNERARFALTTDGEPAEAFKIACKSCGEKDRGRECEQSCSGYPPTFGKGIPESPASAFEPSLYRGGRQPESCGRFVTGQTFEIAENEGLTVHIGQASQFQIQRVQQLAAAHAICGPRQFGYGDLTLAPLAPFSYNASIPRHPPGREIQPVGDGIAPAPRRCLAAEQEKSGLAGILGVLLRRQDTATNAEHHARVAPKENGEGGLVRCACETV